MAEVPEINELPMDSYSEEEFYAESSSEIKIDRDHLEWTSCISTQSRCRSGIIREIRKSRKPLSCLKKAIKLVVIIGRVSGRKNLETDCMFEDHDLLNHILVEEDICINEVNRTSAAPPKFRYSNTTVHIIRDSSQKNLMLQEYQGSAHLVALFLQGSNLNREANINMGAYISSPFNGQNRPVTLGIVGRDLYLSCVLEEEGQDSPVLSLKEVANIQEKKNDDLLPFLFYRRVNSSSINTFESVAFPGWYISTSQTENQFVQIKPQSEQKHIKDFQLYPVS